MKKALALVLALLLSLIPAMPALAADAVGDVGSSDYYADTLNKLGLFHGTDKGFELENTVTRAQAAVMLVRLLGAEENARNGDYAHPFTDVPDWAKPSVAYMYANGLTKGVSDTRFDPDGLCDLRMYSAFLLRALGYEDGNDFGYDAAVDKAAEFGIVKDNASAGEFLRGDMAAMSYFSLSAKTKGTGTTLLDKLVADNAVNAEAAKSLQELFASQDSPTMAKNGVLIAYFSHTGNTKTVAEHIQTATGGLLFEITTENPYPDDYSARLSQASQELASDYRPALSSHVSGMDEYSTIFVGYPIWHGNTPMAIRSFLEEYDLSGKTIIPFCTSGSSGIAQSVSAVRNLCPNSEVLDGLGITSANLSRAYELVSDWIGSLGQDDTIYLKIGERTYTATLTDNSSAQALKELLAAGPVTIDMRDYGNMEKVGGLGKSLPTNDEQTTTEPGDLILYQGNAFVIYYAANSWNFTRLGKINDVSRDELKEALGDGNVTVTLSLKG
jgi:flavodoxin